MTLEETAVALRELFHEDDYRSPEWMESMLQQMGFGILYRWYSGLHLWEAEVWDGSLYGTAKYATKAAALGMAVVSMMRRDVDKATWETKLEELKCGTSQT